MKLKSVSQVPLDGSDRVLTTAIVEEVQSSCILARQTLDVLGRPGADNDLEMLGSGRTWMLAWTEPQLTLARATRLMEQAIAPLTSKP